MRGLRNPRGEHSRMGGSMTELELAVRAVVDAVEVEGPQPRLHRKVLTKHREEWPTLHHALDELRQIWHEEER